MKIWIDGFEANVVQRLGSGQVAFELLKNIEKLDHQNDYTILLPNQPLADFPQPREGFRYKKIFPKRLITWLGLPGSLFSTRSKPDVFFSPTHYIPRFSPASVKRVMMVLDLAFLHFEETFTKKDYLQLKNWTRFSAEHAQHIIAISHSTKKDIVNSYGIDEKKITVCYCGYDKDLFKPISDTGKISVKKGQYGIEGRYILFLGTVQPRKNLSRLIESFTGIEDCKLVVIGKISGEGRSGWKNEEILSLPKKLGIEKKVLFTGYVPNQDLPYLYSGAQAYILPSLWEGFGIPALEAMACGTPVIVSNVSSLPEIVGDAGLLVDPESVDSIRNAIQSVLENANLRKNMAEKGLEQVKKFSWSKMAEEVIKVLENV